MRTLGMLLLMLLLGSGQAAALHLVTEDFPPFTYPSKTHPNQASGPMVEVVSSICQRLAIECQIELLPWQRARALAERHEVDGVFSVVRSPEREEQFYFSPMLVRSSYSVFRLKDYAFTYQTPSDLAHHTIGVYGPSGTSYVLKQSIRTVSNIGIELVANNRRLLRMLESGRFGPHGLIVANRDVAAQLLSQEKLTNIEEAGELQVIDYAIALSKKRLSPEQVERFNAAVTDALNDGSLIAILRQYHLEPATPEP